MGLIDDGVFTETIRAFAGGSPIPAGFWPTISLELWLRRHFGSSDVQVNR